MTPININTRVHCEAVRRNEDDFHAGWFLRETLDGIGHDGLWLAARLGLAQAELEALLAQPNMDAELFVRIGLPMEPLFLKRVKEMIFGGSPVIPQT